MAQADKAWRVELAPLYFWTASTSGNIVINGNRNVPVYVDFADAKSKLAGAFTVHAEASKGQWGILGDVNFIHLSSDVTYTTPVFALPIAGTHRLDQTIVNVKVIYEVTRAPSFRLVGGIRTFSVTPTAHFTGELGRQLPDISVTKTEVAGVGGFTFRPKIAKHVILLTEADVGGGSAFTWSALGGVEFQFKPWVGLAAGYSALRIDTGSVPTNGNAVVNNVQCALTQYGPAFFLTLHWGHQ